MRRDVCARAISPEAYRSETAGTGCIGMILQTAHGTGCPNPTQVVPDDRLLCQKRDLTLCRARPKLRKHGVAGEG
jgi:hypothetical protein